jgi:hypothetical protein
MKLSGEALLPAIYPAPAQHLAPARHPPLAHRISPCAINVCAINVYAIKAGAGSLAGGRVWRQRQGLRVAVRSEGGDEQSLEVAARSGCGGKQGLEEVVKRGGEVLLPGILPDIHLFARRLPAHCTVVTWRPGGSL